ncbi:hypothetical protein [Pseudophaeobacter sp.]|uniref:hypothetical protein n=1 Tax=Pseudophaeobacter sp. TaxID=1971739 RepID=UPI003299D4F6
MARFLRISLALMLALVVTLTGHASASAKGSRDAAGQMVICAASGPVAIYVDEDGQPTQAPHYCPDCVMHLLDAVSGPQDLLLRSYGGQAFDRLGMQVQTGHLMQVEATARAPPKTA